MKLDRLAHDPAALEDFFEEALTSMGALCERTWHDRLEVIAEGPAARLWEGEGGLRETELRFLPAEAAAAGAAMNAESEVFPGCPLTFRLSEALRGRPPSLQRVALASPAGARAPEAGVAEKLWRAQFPSTVRWRLLAPFKAAWHFSLAALVRCEIQAIDQHWSLHRVALSLPEGHADEALAAELWSAQTDAGARPPWPAPDPAAWTTLLARALEPMLAPDLAPLVDRQQRHLERELARVDEYFASYEQELRERHTRSRSADANAKHEARVAATRAERLHRRQDQTARHEIRVIPHVDALLMLAEPAFATRVAHHADHVSREEDAVFIPRARRWQKGEGASGE